MAAPYVKEFVARSPDHLTYTFYGSLLGFFALTVWTYYVFTRHKESKAVQAIRNFNWKRSVMISLVWMVVKKPLMDAVVWLNVVGRARALVDPDTPLDVKARTFVGGAVLFAFVVCVLLVLYVQARYWMIPASWKKLWLNGAENSPVFMVRKVRPREAEDVFREKELFSYVLVRHFSFSNSHALTHTQTHRTHSHCLQQVPSRSSMTTVLPQN